MGKVTVKRVNLLNHFDRLIVGALVAFIAVMVLLVLTLVLHSTLQRITAGSNVELHESVDELQETAGELQETVDKLQTIPLDDAGTIRELVAIEQRLDELGENLEDIEQTIEEVAPVPAEDPPPDTMEQITTHPEEIQKDIDQIFTVISWLIGTMSVVTAILLGIVLNRRWLRRFVS